MRPTRFIIAVALLLALITGLAVDHLKNASQHIFADPAVSELLTKGTPAPNFTVEDGQGVPVMLSDFKGKIVVLDFWATWCSPCRASFPVTAAIAKAYRNKGVVVLAVNVKDVKDAFHSWVRQNPEYSPIHFVFDASSPEQDVGARLYHVSSIPTQYVIDREGKVIVSIVGFNNADDSLAEALKQAGTS